MRLVIVHPLNDQWTLHTGTIKIKILLGAIKPAEEVTEDELKAVCRNGNTYDFIESLLSAPFTLHTLQIANPPQEVSKRRREVREVS